MKIENLQIDAHPRTGWQAIDLGVIIARRWYLALFACFALPPLAVLLFCLVFLPDSPGWCGFLIWWLKPLYERIPLSFLSTAIFGDTPTVGDALRRWKACLLPGLFAALTYQRFILDRSFRAPITVLEGLQGAKNSQRSNALNTAHTNEATWLTVLCVHVEAFLGLGLMICLILFVPGEFQSSALDELLFSDSRTAALIINGTYVASIIVMGPFYVAAGFALYLNKRVELEAWDIEIGFKKLATRIGHTVAVALLIGCCQLITPDVAYAQQTPPPTPQSTTPKTTPELTLHRQSSDDPATPSPRDRSAALIEDVLESEDFHRIETTKYPAFLDKLNFDDNKDTKKSNWSLPNLTWLAVVAEVLLWTLLIAALVWLAYRLTLMAQARSSPDEGQAAPPETMFGIALGTDTLPDDLLGDASAHWVNGNQRMAISLLLRGWLVRMIPRYGCRFREGDTEADCLREVRRHSDRDVHDRFARLITAWQYAAYAHQTPEDEVFATLQQDWRSQWTPCND